MSLLSIFGIALALAMDAFAVSLTTGVRLRRLTLAIIVRMAAVFGGFQFLMPVVGWFLGARAQHYIEAYDHWAAFALLALVGGKMVWEAWKHRGEPEDAEDFKDPSRGATLWLLGVATSLDALAVGMSLAVLRHSIWLPATVIGLVCFGLTAVGLLLGHCTNRLPSLNNLGNKANAFGGMVLLLIGLTILHEHGVFATLQS